MDAQEACGDIIRFNSHMVFHSHENTETKYTVEIENGNFRADEWSLIAIFDKELDNISQHDNMVKIAQGEKYVLFQGIYMYTLYIIQYKLCCII